MVGPYRALSSNDDADVSLPLVVDLDGTLVKSDLLIESWLAVLKRSPFTALSAFLWLFRGRAYLKQRIAAHVALDVDTLPYHEELVAYLRQQHDAGRRLVLASASDARIARAVADHFGFFEKVLASDGVTNLAGECKRDYLLKDFGMKGYDYAGNAGVDHPVWAGARKAIVVNPPWGMQAAIRRTTEIEHTFEDRGGRLIAHVRALRLHQWVKNLLVFVPLLAAHRSGEVALLSRALLAFLAFGLCASGSYLLNDLLDLEADRRHPDKRWRPLASGKLSVRQGLILVLPLTGAGLAVGFFAAPALPAVLLLYLVATLAYSLLVKHMALLDVVWLAGLYTLRIVAGSVAVSIWLSEWLLVFSMFLFLSLALLKRHTELVKKYPSGQSANDRGYHHEDSQLLAALGGASGYIAVLVAGLYINSDAARFYYRKPDLLWGACILLLYWISHVWLIAHRRAMNDDPVAFAIRDPTSWVIFTLSAGFLFLAT